MGICRIISAGERVPLKFEKRDGDLTIAADGGYSYCVESGIKCDLVVGDFDSYKGEVVGAEVIKWDTVKDVTDTLGAVLEGFKRGYSSFEIYCGHGDLGHTFANVFTLKYICERGGVGKLFTDREVLTVTKGRVDFDETRRGKISVFALDRVVRVTEVGLKYSLKSFRLKNSYPLGVSNEFIGTKAHIVSRKPTLIVTEEDS